MLISVERRKWDVVESGGGGKGYLYSAPADGGVISRGGDCVMQVQANFCRKIRSLIIWEDSAEMQIVKRANHAP